MIRRSEREATPITIGYYSSVYAGYEKSNKVLAMSAETMPDLQGLWETAQREIALEGSSGCTLKRLWELVNLVDASGCGSSSQESKGNREEETGEAADPDPREFLKGWLWRYEHWWKQFKVPPPQGKDCLPSRLVEECDGGTFYADGFQMC